MLAGAIGGNVRGEELARRLSIFRYRLLVDTAGDDGVGLVGQIRWIRYLARTKH